MGKVLNSLRSQLSKVQPFWFIILALSLILGGIYLHHLITHQTPDRVAITIPVVNLAVYWYGVLIVSGIMLGAYAVSFEVRRRGMDPDHVWGGLVYAVILAVIGARIYHILTPPPSLCQSVGICTPLDYLRDPLRLFDFRGGGLGIFGAIIGAIVGLILYGWRHKIDWLAYADLGSYGLALGQWLGRWGNFFNQELYGKPTDLPWAVYIDRPLAPHTDRHLFHPAFLYESLWNLLVFFILYLLATRGRERLLRGELLGLYLILYPIGRILLETVRLDSATLIIAGQDTGVNIATAVSVVLAAGVAIVLAVRRLRRTAARPS
jgi:phosphatidylglycerol---prolipoprotein diacylglyceryl transferase